MFEPFQLLVLVTTGGVAVVDFPEELGAVVTLMFVDAGWLVGVSTSLMTVLEG